MANATAGPPHPPGDAAQSYQTNIIVCAVITWAIAVAFVAARFYTRAVLLRVFAWEDWVILIALIFATANNAAMIEQAVYGLGRHIWTIPPELLLPLARSGWYAIIWYLMSLWATKISILLLYLRILVYPWARKGTYALIAITIATNIWTIACVLTACIPLSAFWDAAVSGVCHSQDWWWANTGLHMITDFLIYLLPTPVIFTLRMRWRLKLLLLCIFAFGFFVVLVSILRLIWLLPNAGHADFSWDNVSIVYWTCIEVNAAIVCACVMTLKPLLTRLFPRLAKEEPPTSDPEQRAPYSIGGRPLTPGAKSPITEQAGHASWATVSGQTGSDTQILEEGEKESVTLRDTEAQVHTKDPPQTS